MQAVEQSSCYANKYRHLHKCNQMLSLTAYVALHYVLGSCVLERFAPALRLQGEETATECLDAAGSGKEKR